MRTVFHIGGCLLLVAGSAGVAAWMAGRPMRSRPEGCVAIRTKVTGTVDSPAIRRQRIDSPVMPAIKTDVRTIAATNQPKPVCELATDDEQMMDEVLNGLLELIDSAAKSKDLTLLSGLLARLKSLKYGMLANGTPSSSRVGAVKRQLLRLLEGLPPMEAAQLVDEVADLMADSDLAIAVRAKNLLFKTLGDPTISDYVRADIVTAAAAELTDAESISRIYLQFILMRNSVALGAYAAIDESGTEMARSLMARSMGSFTSNAEITTIEQFRAWYEQNPDNTEYDDIFYGHKDLVKDAQSAK